MKLSETSNTCKGFAFGEQKSLFIETASKRRAQKNYYWNVDPNVSKDGCDELSGFFTLNPKKRKIVVREDSDGNAEISRKDRVIGRGRVPADYEFENGFGYISFKSDATTRSKNGESFSSFKYYVTIDPSEADLERGLDSVSTKIMKSGIRESDLMRPRDISVSAFEEMVRG